MLHLIELAIPLRQAFVTASATLRERRTLLVGVERDGVTGWGEAAPYPGQGVPSVEETWQVLASGSFDRGTPVPALSNAEADWFARVEGTSLWRRLGGTGNPIRAGLAIGASTGTVDEVEVAVAAGYRRVKLKIRPGHDVAVVREVRRRFPALEIGVDANGSYRPGTDGVLQEIDEIGVAYFEQPYAPAELAAHRALRDRVRAPVALDESVRSLDGGIAALSADAPDVLVVKPGRLGLAACCTIHDLAVDAGLRVKPSGLVETGIGRAFTAALATLPGSSFPDLAPAEAFLEVDPVVPAMSFVDGDVIVSEHPGIGCEPDRATADSFTVRSASVPF